MSTQLVSKIPLHQPSLYGLFITTTLAHAMMKYLERKFKM